MSMGRLCGILFGLLCLAGAEAGAGPPIAGPPIGDAGVARALETEFFVDPVVDANGIDVGVKEGVVTLTGSASSLLERERAEGIAAATVGVEAIVNRIQVAGPDREDAALDRAVERALRRDPAVEGFEVDASIANGVVTLTGTVDSNAERALSGTAAKGVRGVRGVENRIDVRPDAERADAEIRTEIEARLANDVRVDDQGIQVDVDDGAVTLSGVAGSLAEKRRAHDDAWVEGVASVRSEDLSLRWWARDDMRRKQMLGTRSDEEIEEAVRKALSYDPRVDGDVEVEASAGSATLRGVLGDAAAKSAAEADARNVIGVWRVENLVKVRPEEPPSDAELVRSVKEALGEDPFVERWGIDVDARSGTVYLSGEVDNAFEAQRAEALAERTTGTVRVVNRLRYEYAWTPKPDPEIEADLEQQLVWSPYVDADAVEASVEDGVVTLRGEVDTWAEVGDAEQNAYEAGARHVRNELRVIYRMYGPMAGYHLPLQSWRQM